MNTHVGFSGNLEDLQKDIRILENETRLLFESIEYDLNHVKHKHKHNAVEIIIKFKPYEYPPMGSLSINGARSLPKEMSDKVLSEYKNRGGGKVNTETISLIKNTILDSYQALGLYPPEIESFDGEGGHMTVKIVERWVKNVTVIPVDEFGNPKQKSELNLQPITQNVRSIIKEGEPIRMDNIHKANHDVISTKMIESILINFADLEQVGNQLLHDVEVRVKERPRKHVELEAKWKVKSGYRARVEKLVPHVSLSFEHHNLGGHATQVLAKMATPDLTNNSDLDFELVISKPYYLGIADPKKTTLG
jgi:hypothetical protein